MSTDYFVRWKSVVTGPFNLDDIKGLLKAGKISKHHQVSPDKLQWTALKDLPELKSECSVAPVAGLGSIQHQAGNAGRSDAGDSQGNLSDAGRPILKVKNSSLPPRPNVREEFVHKHEDFAGESLSATARWYYSEEGQVFGPAIFSELMEMAASGSLKRSSPVCRDGEESWHKAGDAFPSLWVAQPNVERATNAYYQRGGNIPGYPQPQTQTSALAIWSLVLALVGCSLPAVICGHLGLSKIRKSEGRLTGEGMCIAGLIIGYLALLFWIVFWNEIGELLLYV